MKSDFFAGVAKTNITTACREHVTDDLFGKVLVMKQGNTSVMIVSLDAVAIGGIEEIPDDFLDKFRGEVQKRFGIGPEHILVAASHTHTAPPMLCLPEELLARLLSAAEEAIGKMVPALAGSGKGEENRIQMNRTLRMKEGIGWTMRYAHPCPPNEDVEDTGPVDPEIGILKIENAETGKIMAVVFNYACHPLIGTGGLASAKYPGYAAKLIEESIGDHAVALFIQGAGGNINEAGYKDFAFPYYMEFNGMLLGYGVLRELPKIKTAVPELKMVRKEVVFPRRNDFDERIAVYEKERQALVDDLRFNALDIKSFLPLYMKYLMDPKYPNAFSYQYIQAEKNGDTHWKMLDEQNRNLVNCYLENVRKMERISKLDDDIGTSRRHQKINEDSGESTIHGEVTGIRIGELAILGMPVEPMVEIGLKLKRESGFRDTMIAGFSNGYMHYGPTREYYALHSYDATECFLAPEWLDVCMGNMGKIIKELNTK